MQARVSSRPAERAANTQGPVARRLISRPYWAVVLTASEGHLDLESGLDRGETGKLAVATPQQHEHSLAFVVSQSSNVWLFNIVACCKDFHRPDPRLSLPHLSSEPVMYVQLHFLAWMSLYIKQPAYCQAICGCLKRKQLEIWSAGLVSEQWPHAQISAPVTPVRII